MLYTVRARILHVMHIANITLATQIFRYMNILLRAYLDDQIQTFSCAFKMAFDVISKLRLYIK